MKRLALILFIVAAVSFAAGAALAPKSPGQEPFTPTRMDWLVVELNAWSAMQYQGVGSPALKFSPTGPNEVTVLIHHHPNEPRKSINTFVNHFRQIANETAKSRGWDWIVVKERITTMETQ